VQKRKSQKYDLIKKHKSFVAWLTNNKQHRTLVDEVLDLAMPVKFSTKHVCQLHTARKRVL